MPQLVDSEFAIHTVRHLAERALPQQDEHPRERKKREQEETENAPSDVVDYQTTDKGTSQHAERLHGADHAQIDAGLHLVVHIANHREPEHEHACADKPP